MKDPILFHTFIFLAAAALLVPLASRFKLGSIIGYLLIGILIGPFGLSLIGNAHQIMHFAEFGVIMMLFLIGLELEPRNLWRLRREIVGLGGLQVVLTTLALTIVGTLFQFPWQESLAVSMALSLSSTALVLQMLQEKNLLHTAEGETSFAILLFQDIAVIGILIILPLLALDPLRAVVPDHNTYIDHIPEWAHALLIVITIALVVVLGHFFSHRLFSAVAKTNLREVFTATSLALVIGITLLMETIGASPALGAFVAGVVLANSEYKRTLETDIEPFKGLLLGLFFISVGMGMNFSLFANAPGLIILGVFLIVSIKALILSLLGMFFGLLRMQRVGIALALSQVGEFAFVLLQFASSIQVIDNSTANYFTLIVAISMATTPFLLTAYFRFLVPLFMSRLPPRKYDDVEGKNNVILAGYGRYGQVIGRFLSAQGVETTVLEKNPDQVELLRKFGIKGYFGDAARLDLLQNAGAAQAKMLIIAVDDPETSLEIVELAKNHFPHLKLFARARDRAHAYQLHKAKVDYFHRELLDSSVVMARDIMIALGHSPESMRRRANLFLKFDERSLQRSFEFFEKEKELILFTQEVNSQLEQVLRSDQLEQPIVHRKQKKKTEKLIMDEEEE